MQIIRTTRSKYYLLSLLGALMIAGGVLIVAPSARATVAPVPPSIYKECTPNPVCLGQQIICTIEVVAAPFTSADVVVSDTFPAGLTVTEAAFQFVNNGVVNQATPCAVTGNTITCPSAGRINIFDLGVANQSIRVTVGATAEECGIFENVARAEGIFLPEGTPFSVEDLEEITVVGCDEEQGSGGGGGAGGDAGAAPVTQEGEQESEAGEIDQSFEVS